MKNLANSQLLDVAKQAALLAGEILKKGFGHAMQIDSKKGYHDLVTEYDVKCEKAIISHIRSHFQEHNFLGEEGGERKEHGDDQVLWVIDPLDGTVNFAHKIPMFAVSIAAVYQNQVVCGVIYHPMLDELFTTEKDKGAYLNGKKIKVTKTELLTDTMLATGLPHNVEQNPRGCLDLFNKVALTGTPIRRTGSAALDLAYIAAGRYDGFWEVSLQPWDYAAGKLLIEEAGGILTNSNGDPIGELVEGPIVASNGLVHNELLTLLQR